MSYRWILVIVMLFIGINAIYANDKVVYHIDDTELQATRALRSVRNHLDFAPQTKIIVVTQSEGVDFLLEGAHDKKSTDIMYGAWVSDLKSRGVHFEICGITMEKRGLKPDNFVLEAEFTPAGVVRITQLQHQGYAYIKP